MPMEVTILDPQQNRFSLSGICPHCKRDVVFMIVAGPHVEYDRRSNPKDIYCAAMQCQGCKQYILGIIALVRNNKYAAEYVTHYPLGKPNDDVAVQIPESIAADFKEALRCMFVEAYNATAEMCRRAIESSCIDLKVPNAKATRSLEDKIDWLASKGTITEPLRQVAHKIRLGGNRGAHPSEPTDPVREGTKLPEAAVDYLAITKEHAGAIIQFTREYFHHVYVVPSQLEKYDFSRTPGAERKA